MNEKLDNNKCIFSEEYNNKEDNLTIKKEDIINQLREVFDPEIPVNIYDLGLIYEIKINDEKKVKIEMTLTSPNCPVAEILPEQVKKAVEKTKGVKGVNLKLVFEPPWTPDMMSEAAKIELNMS